MFEVTRLEVGQLKTNCYIVSNNNHALIIDPGDDADFIIRRLSDLGTIPDAIISTHGHFDHVMAVTELKLAYKIPYLASNKDSFLLERVPATALHFLKIKTPPVPMPDFEIKDGASIAFSDLSFNAIGVPGHTPGSIALFNKVERVLFAGDLVFADGLVGRTDLSYSNKEELENSIRRILKLPKNTKIYPGHGKVTTLKNIASHFDKLLAS